MTQPHTTEQIVKDIRQKNPKTTSKLTPAQPYKILHSHKQSYNFDKNSHYRSVVGKFNYLEECCILVIAYATHHCSRFSVNPKMQHAKYLRLFGRYLEGTMQKGTIYYPKTDKALRYMQMLILKRIGTTKTKRTLILQDQEMDL